MNYLIDGHNLIARMPGMSLADPDDEAALVARLRAWAMADRKRRLIVVFDKGLPGGRASHLSSGQVTVLFAPQDRTADALIIQRISKVRNPSEYVIVSSDGEIAAAAAAKRIPRLTAEVFAAQFNEEAGRAAPPTGKEEPRLSANEVAEWLEIFREPEGGTKPLRRPAAVRRVAPAANRPAKPLAGTSSPPPAPKEIEDGLSPDEVDEWMRLFSEDTKK